MPTPSRDARPRAVAVLTGVVLLEALVLAGAALRQVWSLLFEEPLTVGGTVFLAAVFAGGALWLLRVGRGLWRGFRWPRAAERSDAGRILAGVAEAGVDDLQRAHAVTPSPR